MSTSEIVTSVLLIAGVFLAVEGAIGINRFPDVFARMHAVSKPGTLGLVLVMIGASIQLPIDGAVKTLLVIVFQLITAPLAAHAVGRAAYRTGTELSSETDPDELCDMEE